MEDDFDEYDGLIDDDPAVDFILYEGLEREQDKGKEG